MPAYEYEIIHQASGEVLHRFTLALPIAERDGLALCRRTVPSTIGIAGGAANLNSQGGQVLEAYRRLERRLGNNSDFQRRIGHSPETVKRAWGTPATHHP